MATLENLQKPVFLAANCRTRVEGLSVKECARLTGFSESAVKVGVHRGLKALAARIRGKG